MNYGLIGSSLDHSFSKTYFTEKFTALALDGEYHNLEFESFVDLKAHFSELKSSYAGFNVTIPYKTDIISLLDEVDSVASKINAVNCIVMKDGRSLGYNTDYQGFVDSVRSIITDKYKTAYILGSGGASKAVKYALEECFHIPTMTITREHGYCSYDSIRERGFEDYSILVNTTPLGMFPDIMTYPDIDFARLNESHLCIDLIYNPAMTSFLAKSNERGARIKNGYQMLVLQAELSWDLWTR